jgi:hypothetical protein
MMMRWIIALCLTLLVAACGGGDDDVLGLGDRDLDRCSLITVEEAEDWLGAPVTAAPSEGIDGEPDPVTCYYEGASGSVLIQVRDGAVFFAERGSASRIGEDVADLGEDAFTDGDSVRFVQNDWSASVAQILGIPNTDNLLEMAQLMSERLP